MVSKRRKSCARYPGCYNQRKRACEQRVDCQWVVGAGCHRAVTPQYVPVKTAKALTTQLETVRRELARLRGTRVAGDAATTAMRRRINQLTAAEEQLQAALNDVQGLAERRRIGLERLEAELATLRTQHVQCQRRNVNAELTMRALERTVRDERAAALNRQRELEAELERLRNEGVASNERRAQLQAQLDALAAASATSTRALTARLEAAQANLAQLQETHARVEQELRDCSRRSNEQDATARPALRQLQQAEQEKAMLEAELEQAQQSDTELRAQLQAAIESTQRIEASENAVQAELQRIQRALANERDTTDILSRDLERSQTAVQLLEGRVQRTEAESLRATTVVAQQKDAIISDLRDQLATCQQSRKQVQGELTQTRETLAQKVSESEAVLDELQELEAALRDAQTQDEGVRDEFRKVQRERAEQRVILDSLQTRLYEFTQLQQFAKSKQRTLTTQVAEQQRRAESLAAQVARLEQEIAERVGGLQERDATIVALRSEARTSALTVEDLEARVAALQRALEAITATDAALRDMTRERNQLRSVVASQTVQLNILQNKYAALEMQRRELERELVKLRERGGASDAELTQLRAKLETVTTQLADTDAERRRMLAAVEAGNAALSQTTRERDALRVTVNTQSVQLNQLQTQFAALQMLRARLEAELQEMRDKANASGAAATQFRAEVAALTAHIAELEMQRESASDAEIRRLGAELAATNRALAERQQELEKSEEAARVARAEVEKLNSDMIIVRQRSESMAQLLEESQAALQKSSAKNEGYERQVSELETNLTINVEALEAMEIKYSGLERANVRMEGAIEQFQQTIAANQARFAELMAQSQVEAERSKQLSAELDTVKTEREKLARGRARLEQQVSELNATVQAQTVEIEEVQAQQALLRERVQQGKVNVATAKKLAGELTYRLKLSQNQLASTRGTLIEKEKRLVAANRLNTTTEQQLAQLTQARDAALEEARSVQASLDATVAQQAQVIVQLQASQEQVARLQLELAEEQAQKVAALQAQEQLLQDAVGRIQQLQRFGSEAQQLAVIKELEATLLTSQVTTLEAANAELVATLEQTRSDLADAVDEQRRLAVENISQAAEIAELDAQLAQLRLTSAAAVAQAQREIDLSRQLATELQAELEATQQASDASAEAATRALQASNAEVQSIRARLEATTDEANKAVSRIRELEQNVDAARGRATGLEAQLEAVRAANAALTLELREVKAARTEAQVEMRRLTAEMAQTGTQSQEALAALQQQLADAKQREQLLLTQEAQLRSELQETVLELDTADRQKQELEDKLQSALNQLRVSEEVNDDYLNTIVSLRQQFRDQKGVLKRVQKELLEAFKQRNQYEYQMMEVERRMAELGAEYTQRIQELEATETRLQSDLAAIRASGSAQMRTLSEQLEAAASQEIGARLREDALKSSETRLQGQLDIATANVVDLQQQLNALGETTSAQTAEIVAVRSRLREAKAEQADVVHQMETLTVAHATELTKLRETIRASQQEQVELSDALAERDADIVALIQARTALAADVATKAGELEKLKVDLEMVTQQKQEVEEEMARVRQTAEARIAELMAEVARGRSVVTTQENELAVQRERAQALEATRRALAEDLAQAGVARQRNEARARELQQESAAVVQRLDAELVRVTNQARLAVEEANTLRRDTASLTQQLGDMRSRVRQQSKTIALTQEDMVRMREYAGSQREKYFHSRRRMDERVANLDAQLQAATQRAAQLESVQLELSVIHRDRERIQAELKSLQRDKTQQASVLQRMTEQLQAKDGELLRKQAELEQSQLGAHRQTQELQRDLRAAQALARSPYVPPAFTPVAQPVQALPPLPEAARNVDLDSPRDILLTLATNLFHQVRDMHRQYELRQKQYVNTETRNVMAGLEFVSAIMTDVERQLVQLIVTAADQITNETVVDTMLQTLFRQVEGLVTMAQSILDRGILELQFASDDTIRDLRAFAERIVQFFSPMQQGLQTMLQTSLSTSLAYGFTQVVPKSNLLQRVQQALTTTTGTVGMRPRVRQLLEGLLKLVNGNTDVTTQIRNALTQLEEHAASSSIFEYGPLLQRQLQIVLASAQTLGIRGDEMTFLARITAYLQLVTAPIVAQTVMRFATGAQDVVTAAALQVGGAVATVRELLATLSSDAAMELQNRLDGLTFDSLVADGGVAFVNFLNEVLTLARKSSGWVRESALVTRLKELATVTTNVVLDGLRRSALHVQETLANTIEWLAQQGDRTARRVAEQLNALYDALSTVNYTQAVSEVARQLADVMQNVASVLNRVGGSLATGMAVLAGVVYDFGRTTLAATGNLATAAYRAIASFADQAAIRVSEAATLIGEQAGTASNLVVQQLYTLADQLAQTDYAGSFERTEEQLQVFKTRVQALLQEALEAAVPLGRQASRAVDIIQSLLTQLQALLAYLARAAAGVSSTVVAALRQLAGQVGATTQSLLKGVASPGGAGEEPDDAGYGADGGDYGYEGEEAGVEEVKGEEEARCRRGDLVTGRRPDEVKRELDRLKQELDKLVNDIERQEGGITFTEIVAAAALWAGTDARRSQLRRVVEAYKRYLRLAISYYRNCDRNDDLVRELRVKQPQANSWGKLTGGADKAAQVKAEAKLLQQTFLRGGMSQQKFERRLVKLKNKYIQLKGR